MRRIALAGIALAVASVACSAPAQHLMPKPLRGYSVLYRVVEARSNGEARPDESVEVRRPYDGRVETVRPGEPVVGGRITSREHFWQLGTAGKVRFGVLRAPGGPARDASVAALRDAERAGVIEQTGSDVVLGVRCAWFAYRDPAPDSLARPDATSRVESCVDPHGVVLREVWTLHGTLARSLEAVSLKLRTPPRSRFLEGRDPKNVKATDPKGAALLETSTIVKDVSSGRITSPFTFTKPAGWKRDRVSLVATIPGTDARPSQYLAVSYLRGDEAVVVETASSPEFAPPWPTGAGRKVKIGAGEGSVVYFIDRVEVRLLSTVGYARVVAPSERLAMEFVRRLGA